MGAYELTRSDIKQKNDTMENGKKSEAGWLKMIVTGSTRSEEISSIKLWLLLHGLQKEWSLLEQMTPSRDGFQVGEMDDVLNEGRPDFRIHVPP